MKEDIKKALNTLKSGGVILYPTDTVWGLGCDATNETAIERIYQIKQRRQSKSMLVLLDSEDKLPKYVQHVPSQALTLINETERPLTIIYPNAKGFANNLLAEDGSIGIRLVRDKFCQQLIATFNKPLVSTSANITSQPAPMIFHDIDNEVKKAVDYIVRWRQNDLKPAIPSRIIKFDSDGLHHIIRE